MTKRPKFCSECGEKIYPKANFCEQCGNEIIHTELKEMKEVEKQEEVEQKDIQNNAKLVEAIEIPKKLVLLPGEELRGKHLDYYLSNKRLIKHKGSFAGAVTTDLHFKHMKGVEDRLSRPFLVIGLLFGIFSLIIGLKAPVLFGVGIILILLALWYKKSELVVYHMNGKDTIVITNMKQESGQQFATVLREQLYGKEE